MKNGKVLNIWFQNTLILERQSLYKFLIQRSCKLATWVVIVKFPVSCSWKSFQGTVRVWEKETERDDWVDWYVSSLFSYQQLCACENSLIQTSFLMAQKRINVFHDITLTYIQYSQLSYRTIHSFSFFNFDNFQHFRITVLSWDQNFFFNI